jgi:hypothetical protein
VTDCAPDDSIKDHKRVAVISRPGFTGLFPLGFSKTFLLCCFSQLFVSASAGKKALFVKGFSRAIPTVYLPEQMSGYNGHGLVPRHLCFILLFVIKVPIETTSFDQRQGDCLQDLPQQFPALFADLVLSLECAALSGSEIETSIAHQFTPVIKIRERASFCKQSREVFCRDDIWSRRWDQRIILSQLIQDRNHLLRNLFFSLYYPKIIIQTGAEVFFKNLSNWHIVQNRTICIFPQTFKTAGPYAECRLFHFSAENSVAVFDNTVRVTAILFDKGQSRGTIEKVFLEGIITEEFNQHFADPAAVAGDGNITFVVYFMQFPEHQVLFANHAEFDDFIQFPQSVDYSWIFLVSLVVVITLDDTELGNRLCIYIVCEKSRSSGCSHEFILILACRLTDNPQVFSAMVHGDAVIGEQSFLNRCCSVTAGIGKLFTIDFKEKTQRVFVDVHRDIDNIIKIDFPGNLRNFHSSFSFDVDSTGCDRQKSYCPSAFEGEAFLLAA